jgi:hypothetical protein
MIRGILFPWYKAAQGRIFISYRREDTRWVAGRLADSLVQYFGDERVFRDIEGIGGGADFGEVIHETLGAADAAVIVIGSEWLNATDETGQRRLDDPGDWVAREIAATLEAGIPVYPVLVEDTQMPRAGELPERLQPLTRYHAVSISDQRWASDVARLAKIVALDIPSATERKLHGLNVLISLALLLAVFTTVAIVVWNLVEQIASGDPIPGGLGGSLFDWRDVCLSWLPSSLGPAWCVDSGAGHCLPYGSEWPLSLWQSGITFLAVGPCSVLLFVFARLVDEARRLYFLGAAWVGTVGTLTSFLLLKPICNAYEPVFMFFGSTVTALLMLALMNVSGFRPR